MPLFRDPSSTLPSIASEIRGAPPHTLRLSLASSSHPLDPPSRLSAGATRKRSGEQRQTRTWLEGRMLRQICLSRGKQLTYVRTYVAEKIEDRNNLLTYVRSREGRRLDRRHDRCKDSIEAEDSIAAGCFFRSQRRWAPMSALGCPPCPARWPPPEVEARPGRRPNSPFSHPTLDVRTYVRNIRTYVRTYVQSSDYSATRQIGAGTTLSWQRKGKPCERHPGPAPAPAPRFPSAHVAYNPP
jgi:hypothetical protein